MRRSRRTRLLLGWRGIASLLALAFCALLLVAARGADAGTGAANATAVATVGR